MEQQGNKRKEVMRSGVSSPPPEPQTLRIRAEGYEVSPSKVERKGNLEVGFSLDQLPPPIDVITDININNINIINATSSSEHKKCTEAPLPYPSVVNSSNFPSNISGEISKEENVEVPTNIPKLLYSNSTGEEEKKVIISELDFNMITGEEGSPGSTARERIQHSQINLNHTSNKNSVRFPHHPKSRRNPDSPTLKLINYKNKRVREISKERDRTEAEKLIQIENISKYIYIYIYK